MFNVAIDGPAGAGKSTVAKRVAKETGFIYVDTGAMYRAMALSCIRAGISKEDEEGVAKQCRNLEISLSYNQNREQQILLNGENVNPYIRTEEVGNITSAIAVYKGVREKLLNLQRQIGKENNVVMDGRDIGTNVLKDAQLKVYLTASVETRAKRRFAELSLRGVCCDLADIEKDIMERDSRDMNRETAPLKQAEDAVYLDSSDMSVDEVVEKIKLLMAEAGWK